MTDNNVQFREHLNQTQLGLVNQALAQARRNRNFHGLCFNLPMGSGKTRTMMITGLNLYQQFLWVCSKTLLGSAVAEIKKVFGKDVKYEVVHRDHMGKDMNMWRPKPETRIVLTTSEMVSRSYRYNEIENDFVTKIDKNDHYSIPRKPYGPKINKNDGGPNIFHSIDWEGVVVDEFHNYTNCKTTVCRAIASLCCRHRWLLSGTALQEPQIERVLGFFMLLNQTVPDNLKDCRDWINSGRFVGFQRYSLSCPPPQIETRLSEHQEIYQMNRSERKCYQFFQDITEKWFEYYQEEKARLPARDPLLRKIRGHLLSLLTYLRLSLVSPRQALERLLEKLKSEDCLAGLKGKTEYVEDLLEEIPVTPNTSRLIRLKRIIDQHPNQRILVFGSFTSTLALAMNYFDERQPKDQERYSNILVSDMSSREREKAMSDFRTSENGILFLTYQIGSEGLNLQEATAVIYLDLYWNHGKHQQALARCYRTGQTADQIDYYYIISNTQFEKGILSKQREKLRILRGLNDGQIAGMTLPTIGYREMVTLLQQDAIHEGMVALNEELRGGT
jgi:SNF2 family DNA or RNA helicase